MSSVSHPEWKVQVFLYDLSGGLAKGLSQGLLGKQIDGIWHSAIVVYGQEYFYGGGICFSAPGQSMAGNPVETFDMGFTRASQADFHQFLQTVAGRFSPANYSLLNHNCNNFTDEACKFLTGRPIPGHITGLPAEVLNSPMGAMFAPMVQQMETSMKSSQMTGGASFIPGWSGQSLNNNASAAGNFLYLPPVRSNLPPDRFSPVAEAKAPEAPVEISPLPLIAADRKLSSFLTLLKANNKKAQAELQISPDELAALESAAVDSQLENAEAQNRMCEILWRLLNTWPSSLLFPVFGILRVSLLTRPGNSFFAAQHEALSKRCLALLKDSTTPPAVATLALCALANGFAHNFLGSPLSQSPAVLELSQSGLASANAQTRLMASALFFNAAVQLANSAAENFDTPDEFLLEFCESLVKAMASTGLEEEPLERLMSAAVLLLERVESAAVLLQSLGVEGIFESCVFVVKGNLKISNIARKAKAAISKIA